jgi:uncharacterized Ntn-hydrolase superfamily protein
MRHGTYSIIARDPATGQCGGAVQSHWFSVGSLCVWAQPGAGAVATQSVVEPAYGPRGLDAMGSGAGAVETLGALLAVDPSAAVRQVALIDVAGVVSAHTGEDCIAHAGHVTGDGFSCQANMMAGETVPAAMAEAFERATGDLAARLMAALHAAEAAGGDVRGRQSAALVVAPAQGEAWERVVELRVEDHPDPIAELERLLGLHRAYALASEADELTGAGSADAAAPLYRQAAELAPQSDELLFWAGLAIAQGGDVEAGAAMVRRAAEVHAGWRVLLPRLSPEFAPAGAEVAAALGW